MNLKTKPFLRYEQVGDNFDSSTVQGPYKDVLLKKYLSDIVGLMYGWILYSQLATIEMNDEQITKCSTRYFRVYNGPHRPISYVKKKQFSVICVLKYLHIKKHFMR